MSDLLRDAISGFLSSNHNRLIIKGRAEQVLPHLPDGCVDLTVTDPAYESLERHRATGTTTRLKESKSSSNAWFTTFPNTGYAALFAELHRVHAENTHCYVFCDSETEHVILCGYNPYTALEYRDEYNLPPKGPWKAWPPLTWVKTKAAGYAGNVEDLQDADIRSGMGYHWRRSEERILFLERGRQALINKGWKNVLCGPRAAKGAFPTQKPASVISKLIRNSSCPGELVLDPMAGSGVVGVVALLTGRRAILIDLDITWMTKTLAGALIIDAEELL